VFSWNAEAVALGSAKKVTLREQHGGARHALKTKPNMVELAL
jgi:hypothetical protein